MSVLIQFFLNIYIFVSSWTMAYKIGNWLTIPNLILVILLILYGLSLFRDDIIYLSVYKKEDVFLLVSIFFIIISYIFNKGNINYIIAYIFTFIFMYLIGKQIFIKFADINQLLSINLLTIKFITMFVLLEFIFNYVFNINIREFFKFGNVPEASYLEVLKRSYGFSTEPTNLGYYLNAMLPLALWSLFREEKKYKYKIFFVIIFLLGWLTTFSTATIFSIFISILTVLIFNVPRLIQNKYKKKNLLLLIVFIVILLLFCHQYKDNLELIFGPIRNKLNINKNDDLNIFSGRYYRWTRDFIRFKKKPILGYGPGSTSIEFGSSSINWYLTFIVENGLISFIFLCLFFTLKGFRIYKSDIYIKNIFLIGYIASLIHLFSFSSFYDPAFWILIILFDFFEYEYR